MFLTIFTVCPCELDAIYLKLYREAIIRWNPKFWQDVQVILLPQSPIEPRRTDPFEVVETEYAQVNGYPVWDVMRAVRQAWPRVQGKYVTFDHSEFIWGPNRLENTIAWLRAYQPLYSMGNLRRPGDWDETCKINARDDISPKPSTWFRSFLEGGDWEGAAHAFEYLQTVHWMYWAARQQRPGPNQWMEDVFYADKEWLDLWGFARHDLELPFQDVFDLMQMGVRTLFQYGLVFECVRMPQSVNRILHLWHPRAWGSWTPEMRDWFLAQPERWRKTSFLDRKLWDRLIAFQRNPQSDCAPVSILRFGPRGTAIRYGVSIADWLNQGGVEVMQEYYAERKERTLR